MKVTLLSPDDQKWRGLLALASHEFYDYPDYLALEAQRMGGKAWALAVEDQSGALLVPGVVREVPGTEGDGQSRRILDVSSPYGYAGVVVSTPTADAREFVARAVDVASPILREAGIVSAFIRLNPLWNKPEDFSSRGWLVSHGPSVWLDLELSDAELQRHLRGRYRSYINAIAAEGVRARFDEEWSHLPDFVRLYHHTMDRVDAADWYYFEPSYFEGLKAVLGDGLKLCIVEQDSRIIAAGLFGVSNGVVQYLLSGTDNGSSQPNATKLMIVYVRDWAKRAGLRVFHLGGGLGGREDKLTQFKRGFSKLSSTFHSWRLVFDPERYAQAVHSWEEQSGQRADDWTGFFPAYRKPMRCTDE